jgi:heme/copper-type cytochrome/quinol oxidase subunit 2
MSISSHFGMVVLVIVGFATVIGVIVIAVIETRRPEKNEPIIPQQSTDKFSEKKKT